MTFGIGLDWGGTAHAVCVLDRGSGAVIDRFEARHDVRGLRDRERRLARHGAAGDLPVAVERPSGLIVDALVAAGQPVVPIHPNAVKASRPRYRANGAKDDRGDALLLADLLRTDGHRFRPGAAARHCPWTNGGQWRAFADIDSPIAPAFLERCPTPDSAARLGVTRLASVLAQHRCSGGRSPDERLARLGAAPQGLAGAAELGEDRARCLTPDPLAADAGLYPVTRQSGKSFRWACNRRLRTMLICFADTSRHA